MVLQDGSGNAKGKFGYNAAATSYLNGSVGDVCLSNTDTSKAVRIGVGTTPYLSVSTSGASVSGALSSGSITSSGSIACTGNMGIGQAPGSNPLEVTGQIKCSSLYTPGTLTCSGAATTGALNNVRPLQVQQGLESRPFTRVHPRQYRLNNVFGRIRIVAKRCQRRMRTSATCSSWTFASCWVICNRHGLGGHRTTARPTCIVTTEWSYDATHSV